MEPEGPRLLYTATRAPRDPRKGILVLAGEEALPRRADTPSRKTRWVERRLKDAGVEQRHGTTSGRQPRRLRLPGKAAGKTPAAGAVPVETAGGTTPPSVATPLRRGPMGARNVRVWEARPGCYSRELGGGGGGGCGGCCLRRLRQRAMEVLEGETRGDATTGLELQGQASRGRCGPTALRRGPRACRRRGGRRTALHGSGDHGAARGARSSVSPQDRTPAASRLQSLSTISGSPRTPESVSLVRIYYLCRLFSVKVRVASPR